MTAHASANRLNVITMAIKSKIVLVSVKTIFVRMKHLQNQTANAIALK